GTPVRGDVNVVIGCAIVGVDVARVAAGELPLVEEVVLFDLRQQENHPGTAPAAAGAERRRVGGATRRQHGSRTGALVVVQGDADLLEVVLAGGAVGGLADFLHGGDE